MEGLPQEYTCHDDGRMEKKKEAGRTQSRTNHIDVDEKKRQASLMHIGEEQLSLQ